MTYHYTDGGLDNVFLEDGYTIHETKYGKGVSIVDTEGLHRALGRWLIDLPKPLIGAELRFLRIEMDLSQKHLASIIGSNEQAVRRWEKARKKPIPGTADRLVRVLYNEYSGGDGSIRRMVDRLAELDQVGSVSAHLRETKSGWKVQACTA